MLCRSLIHYRSLRKLFCSLCRIPQKLRPEEEPGHHKSGILSHGAVLGPLTCFQVSRGQAKGPSHQCNPFKQIYIVIRVALIFYSQNFRLRCRTYFPRHFQASAVVHTAVTLASSFLRVSFILRSLVRTRDLSVLSHIRLRLGGTRDSMSRLNDRLPTNLKGSLFSMTTASTSSSSSRWVTVFPCVNSRLIGPSCKSPDLRFLLGVGLLRCSSMNVW